MATSKERGQGAKKQTRKRSKAMTGASAQKKFRKVGRAASTASTRKKPVRVRRATEIGQRDFFGENNAVSPQVGQNQIRRGSLVLSPTVGQSNLLLFSSPVAAESSPRRRVLFLVLLLLLMSGSFWLGRFTYHPTGAPVDIMSMPSTAMPASAASNATAKSAANVASRLVASLKAKVAAIRRAPETALQEVSVGTSTHGGITLKFDHPVSWTVKDNDGRGEAEVDIVGVHNVGTFPRNLPLPPGVMVIHAGITGPDTLRLWFTLLPNLRISSSPANGPSQVLNVFFRADTQSSTTRAQPQAAQPTGA